jgi:DNA polymerase-3 subunit epsilon
MHFDEKVIYVDLETTGTDFNKDRIVQIGAITADGHEIDTLINPQMPISSESTVFHKIVDEMVIDAPTFKEYAPILIAELEKAEVFVAYNYVFDFQFLQQELFKECKYVLSEQKYTFIDPYKIFRKQFPHNLSNAYKHYTGETLDNAHNALADIKATKEVLNRQIAAYPELFNKGLNHVQKVTIGTAKILGKWFDLDEQGNYKFTMGKYKSQSINGSQEHRTYLGWIARLADSTISEKAFIKNYLKNLK